MNYMPNSWNLADGQNLDKHNLFATIHFVGDASEI